MWACALAWAGSAIVFMVMLVSVPVVLTAPDMLTDELYRQSPELQLDGLTPSTLRSTVLYAGVVLLAWSAVASVFAAYAWRGRPWARTALLVLGEQRLGPVPARGARQPRDAGAPGPVRGGGPDAAPLRGARLRRRPITDLRPGPEGPPDAPGRVWFSSVMSDPTTPGNPYGEPANPYGQPAPVSPPSSLPSSPLSRRRPPSAPPAYGQQPQYGQQPPQYGQPACRP